MLRYIKVGLAALAGLAALTLAVVLVRGAMEAPTPIDPAPIVARAGTYDTEIKRDEFGIPHISGPRDADVAFGLGFAHSEDDFVTIQNVAIAVRGHLAAHKGKGAAISDYLVSLMGIWDTVNTKYDTLPEDVRKVIEAYADGVNYYGVLHPDEVEPGFLPLTGKDVAAGFVFKTPFFYGLDRTLIAVFEGRIGDKTKELSKQEKDAFLPITSTLPIGSNGVAIAPSRSDDGVTRLLVNSHQPYSGPVAWYEAELHSGEGWHVSGGFFPGSPFMLHGHNENLGWANTVNEPDLVDIYKLKINPDNENQYLLDGTWHDFERKRVEIKVDLWGPFWWTVERDVLRSEHGPVLKTPNGYFAVRYAGMDEIRQVAQYYRLDKANNLDGFLDALRMQALPSINYIYADRDGNIAYIYNGQFPERKPGFDWKGVLPGDRSDLIWHAYVPFDDIPHYINPASGVLFNANNSPFRATTPSSDLDASGFPDWMGIQHDMTNRAYRMEETFGTDPQITREEFRKYKFDVTYSKKSELAALVRQVTAVDPGEDKDLAQAQDILRNWNLEATTDSRGAALGILMAEPVIHARIVKETPPDPMDTLHEAITRLKTHFGRLDPEWGEVNRIIRGNVDLPVAGGPDLLRAIYARKLDDGRLKAVGGDTFFMFVEWDRNGKVSSQNVHQFGSATSHTSSPHYADQTPLYAREKMRPELFTEAELKGHVREDYRPGEREKDSASAPQ